MQQDYSKYRDQMSDYFNELSLAQSAAQAAAQDDYNRWAAERSYWLQKQQDEQSYYAAAQKAASGSGGGSGSSGKGKTYTSDYYKMSKTGQNSYRFQDVGTQYTENQLRGFQQTLSMNRSNAGRAQLIKDALDEGKITEAQAETFLRRYGIIS